MVLCHGSFAFLYYAGGLRGYDRGDTNGKDSKQDSNTKEECLAAETETTKRKTEIK